MVAEANFGDMADSLITILLVLCVIGAAVLGFTVFMKQKTEDVPVVPKKPQMTPTLQEITEILGEADEEPVMCLTSLKNLPFTQRLQCYKAIREHIEALQGPEAAKKLDAEVLPTIVDDQD